MRVFQVLAHGQPAERGVGRQEAAEVVEEEAVHHLPRHLRRVGVLRDDDVAVPGVEVVGRAANLGVDQDYLLWAQVQERPDLAQDIREGHREEAVREVEPLLRWLVGHAEVEGPDAQLQLLVDAQVLVLRAEGKAGAKYRVALEVVGAGVVRAREGHVEEAAPLHVGVRHPGRAYVAQLHDVLPRLREEAPDAVGPELLVALVHGRV
mmetsp:Transcript_140607/g.437309  ORF Transcript_140607/g.437309 Transcript_140607/m.437309 type:complete len:207 (+) Transcript_140607:978-1598(+)